MSIKPDSLPAASWWRKVREALGAVQAPSRMAGELMLDRSVQPVYEIGRLGVRQEREAQQEEEVLEFGCIFSSQSRFAAGSKKALRLYPRGYTTGLGYNPFPGSPANPYFYTDYEVLGYAFAMYDDTGAAAHLTNIGFGVSAGGIQCPIFTNRDVSPALIADQSDVQDVFGSMPLANAYFTGDYTEGDQASYYGLPQRRQSGEVLQVGYYTEDNQIGNAAGSSYPLRSPYISFTVKTAGNFVLEAYMLIKTYVAAQAGVFPPTQGIGQIKVNTDH